MSYNEILSRLEADDENPIMWKYKCISGRQGPLRPSHPSYMGSSYNLNIEWKNGEITPEPLDIFAADDPVVRAIYGKQNILLDTPDWQRFERITNKYKKLLRMANQAKLRSFRTTPKFMYENEISKNYADAPRLDRLHGNTKWQNAIDYGPKAAQLFISALFEPSITKQSIVETATYGSEFVAARTCAEQIMDLRITLTHFGVPIQTRSWIFGDNKSVVISTTCSESKLYTKTCRVVFPLCTRSNTI